MGKQEAKLILVSKGWGSHFGEERRARKRKKRKKKEKEKKSKKIQVCVFLGIMGIWIIKVWYGELVAHLV